MASADVNVSNYTAVYHSTTPDGLHSEDLTHCVVEIRSPQRPQSVSCKNCESKKRRQQLSVYARIRRFLLGGINIEVKLKRYNVKTTRAAGPFNFLRNIIGNLLQGQADAKFTDEELETLPNSQLRELSKSLQTIISERKMELERERIVCKEEKENLERNKNKAREVEAMAWVTLKPFINHHPSLDDLTRALMF